MNFTIEQLQTIAERFAQKLGFALTGWNLFVPQNSQRPCIIVRYSSPTGRQGQMQLMSNSVELSPAGLKDLAY